MSSNQGSHRGTAIADVEECRRRLRLLLDAEEAIDDDETARQKMRDAKVYARGVRSAWGEHVGFDPDNVADVKSFSWLHAEMDVDNAIKPMAYFAKQGDLPMMRWLYVNGADTRDEDVAVWFPMWAAQRCWNNSGRCIGQLHVCKWLFEHGAAEDIKRPTRVTREVIHVDVKRPLTRAFRFLSKSKRNSIRWLILNGALCKDDNSGDLDVEKMKVDLDSNFYPRRVRRERAALLKWATDLHRARYSFLLFLSGALTAPLPTQPAGSPLRTVSPLQCFGGFPGVLELIGDYAGHRQCNSWRYDAGFVRGREARIVRQLTELLSALFRS